eukprot:g7719.t2
MAHLHKGAESSSLIDEGISKLHKAIEIDQNRHDAYWCLGNALTSKGFLVNGNKDEAQYYFDQALDYFKAARDLDPSNDIYLKAIDVTQRAPEIYDQLQSQMSSLGASPDIAFGLDEGPSGSMMEGGPFDGGKRSKKSKSEDFWWDVAGWVCLIGLGVMLLSLSQKPTPLK